MHLSTSINSKIYECLYAGGDVRNRSRADVNEGGIYKQGKQFLLLKKRKMDEIQKNENGKCLRIRPPISPDVDEAI